MNPSIRTTLLEALKNNETDLLTFLEDFSEADFFKKQSDLVWSMAEILEHIILTEAYVVKKLKSCTPSEGGISSRHPNGKVEYLVLDRNRKVPAPEVLVPKGKYKTKQVAIETFQEVRATSNKFLTDLRTPLVEIGFPHFTLGMLNGENWMTFVPAHCERHRKQMMELG